MPEILYAFGGSILAVGMSITDILGILPLDPELPCPFMENWMLIIMHDMKIISHKDFWN
jgi:hypothetical protein